MRGNPRVGPSSKRSDKAFTTLCGTLATNRWRRYLKRGCNRHGSLTDSELQALIDATYKAPQTAPGLLAWIDAACEWELNRRAGRDYELQPPEAAIPPEEDAIS